PSRHLGGQGARRLAEVGEKLLGGLVRGGQKEARGRVELPNPLENPPLGPLPEALDRAQTALSGRLLELSDRGDASPAQRLDTWEAALGYATQVGCPRGVLLPKLLEASGRARPIELGYHGGQTRSDAVK